MAENLEYHNSIFMVTLAEKLGLNPEQITNMSVTGSPAEDVVEVVWEGTANLSMDTFNEILDQCQVQLPE